MMAPAAIRVCARSALTVSPDKRYKTMLLSIKGLLTERRLFRWPATGQNENLQAGAHDTGAGVQAVRSLWAFWQLQKTDCQPDAGQFLHLLSSQALALNPPGNAPPMNY